MCVCVSELRSRVVCLCVRVRSPGRWTPDAPHQRSILSHAPVLPRSQGASTLRRVQRGLCDLCARALNAVITGFNRVRVHALARTSTPSAPEETDCEESRARVWRLARERKHAVNRNK